MAKLSEIQWTDHTWNPWHGCTKVSPGCKYCYMYRDKDRYGQDPTTVIRSKHNTFVSPINWKEPARVFTCSWSDFFIEDADIWRAAAWDIIKKTPHLTYQILTKRPERIQACLPPDWGEGYPNVWLGVSVEDQQQANKRIPILLEIPAKVRFLSCEPLLGEIELTRIDDGDYIIDCISGRVTDMGRPCHDTGRIDWVIIGGESGNNHGKYQFRPCEIFWIYQIVIACYKRAPIFVKQLGTHLATVHKLKDRHGGDPAEWPARSLAIREFPEVNNSVHSKPIANV